MIKVRVIGNDAVTIDERREEIQYFRKDESGHETKMSKYCGGEVAIKVRDYKELTNMAQVEELLAV